MSTYTSKFNHFCTINTLPSFQNEKYCLPCTYLGEKIKADIKIKYHVVLKGNIKYRFHQAKFQCLLSQKGQRNDGMKINDLMRPLGSREIPIFSSTKGWYYSVLFRIRRIICPCNESFSFFVALPFF